MLSDLKPNITIMKAVFTEAVPGVFSTRKDMDRLKITG